MPWRERLWRAIEAAPAVTLGDAFWYGLMAGLAWLLFYVLRPSGLAHRKIAPQFPSRRQLGREIFYSLRSLPGQLRVVLQLLGPAAGHEPSAIRRALRGRERGRSSLGPLRRAGMTIMSRG